LPDPEQRFIGREEFLDILGGASHLSAADLWAEGLAQECMDAAAAQDVSSIVVPSLRPL
jgi:hypothetical protein